MSGIRSAIGIEAAQRMRSHAHFIVHALAATPMDVLDKARKRVLIMPALFAIRQTGMLRGEARPRCEARGRRWA